MWLDAQVQKARDAQFGTSAKMDGENQNKTNPTEPTW